MYHDTLRDTINYYMCLSSYPDFLTCQIKGLLIYWHDMKLNGINWNRKYRCFEFDKHPLK